MRLSDTARYNLSPIILYLDIYEATPPSKLYQFFMHIDLKCYLIRCISDPDFTDPYFVEARKIHYQKEYESQKRAIKHYKSLPCPRLRPGWERKVNATDIWYLSPGGKIYWNEAPLKAILTRPPRDINLIETENNIIVNYRDVLNP